MQLVGGDIMEKNCVEIIGILKKMIVLPKLTLIISNENRDLYNYFTKPHPRYKIIKNKRWGVAIIEMPSSFELYLKGKNKQALRTNRRKSIKAGYFFAIFNPMELVPEIMDINMSSYSRQGRRMNEAYTNEAEVNKWILDKPILYGVFDKSDRLKAYAHVPDIGEVCVISRLLGHKDSLDDGVMYLLISEVINNIIGKIDSLSIPKYIMYDTFFGANTGLKYFKERLGFEPYNINWRLE